METPLRILWIESTPTEPELLLYGLQQIGYHAEYESVQSTDQLCDALKKPWDLILCDYAFADFNAQALLKHLKHHEIDIPFITIADAVDEQTAVNTIRAGADDFVLKDNPTCLVVAIERAMQSVQQRRKHAEEEQQFRTLIENSSDAIALINREGIVIYQTPSAEHIADFPLDEIIGINFYKLLHRDDHAYAQRVFDTLIQMPNGANVKGEVRFYHRNFGWKWMEFSATNLLEDPLINAFVVNYRDITERKQAEETRRQFAERLKTLHAIDQAILNQQPVESIAQIALNYFVQQTQIWCASFILLNIKENEGVVYTAYAQEGQKRWESGKRFSLHTFSQEDIDMLKEGKTQVVQDITEQETLAPTLAALRDQGLCAYATVPLIAHGQLLGAFNMGADAVGLFSPQHLALARELADQVAIALHQMRLREEIQQNTLKLEQHVMQRTNELQRAKDHVEAILNHANDAIVLISLQGMIWQTNPAFDQLFGYQSEEPFGKALVQLAAPDHADQLATALEEIIRDQQPKRIEVIAQRKDGTKFAADFAIAAVIHDGESRNLVCSIRDMSSHKEAEQKLKDALMEAQELNVLKTRFVSMVSHDFRNPLTVIQTSAELLRRYDHNMDRETRARHFEKIQLQIQRMVVLLNDVLTISRSDAGALAFKPILTNLDDFCHQIADDFVSLPDLRHHLVYTCKKTPIWTMVDTKLMHQALINLLTNAIKYSPAGSRILFELSADETHIHIRISDQGIGIPETDQKRLFEAFHRAENVGNIEGSGLGLSIVKRAIDAHNGDIVFDSEQGVGTTVTISSALH